MRIRVSPLVRPKKQHLWSRHHQVVVSLIITTTTTTMMMMMTLGGGRNRNYKDMDTTYPIHKMVSRSGSGITGSGLCAILRYRTRDGRTKGRVRYTKRGRLGEKKKERDRDNVIDFTFTSNTNPFLSSVHCDADSFPFATINFS